MKKRYDNLISNEIGSLTNEKLVEAIHVIAKLAIMNYNYGPQDKKEKKLDFINRRIKRKLDKKVISLIYIEILNLGFNKRNKNNKIDEGEENKDNKIENVQEYSNIDFNDLKTFIFEEFLKNMNKTNNKDNIYNYIENLIKLIDCLEGKNEKGKVDNQNMNKEENEKNINEFLEINEK